MISVNESNIVKLLKYSVGKWTSIRQYYDCQNNKLSNFVSHLSVSFLDRNDIEVKMLAELHDHKDENIVCGAKIDWETFDAKIANPISKGTILLASTESFLYRNRGFYKNEPVKTKILSMTAQKLVTMTEYDGHQYKEEIKVVGDNHRTRQMKKTKDGKVKLFGQYIEVRKITA